jgi:hypothetical protein
MSEHTPGPWTVEADDEGIYVLMGPLKGEDEHLAVYTAPFNDETPSARRVADARLIAAAPDLLAACEYLTTLIVEGGNGEGWTLTEAYDRASEAIAKARGES